ncbi:MAG: beta-glucosidase [Deltaproteobacteria bacterium]|nr:beta-glucosidase [Deltaproteobacteria bacterium]
MELYGLRASDFGAGFTWGVATASYQIEGAWNVDGKGPSIWDTFTHRRRWPLPTVRSGENGDVACDFYHRYRDDVTLSWSLGFGAKRFSISWPRVLPMGVGRVNAAGLDFYSRVVDACLENGLDPWITLYHWDLPQALQDRGGWANRDIVGWFSDYARVVAERLGDRVKRWMVFNEPLSFCAGGYLIGAGAPGIFSRQKFLASVHHVNLCQAAAAKVLRDKVANAVVGTTHVTAPVKATGDSARHLRAQRSLDALLNRVYIEPNLGLGYPTNDCGLLRPIERYILSDDERAIQVDFDFIGAQYYTRVSAPPLPIPLVGTLPRRDQDFRRYEINVLGNTTQPEGIYEALERLHSYKRFPSIVVTENGTSVPDDLEGDRVYDVRRIDYYRRHLAQVLRAKGDGMPIDGYFCWSLLDNFEWAEGYVPRFGLVYVDYATQKRVVKDSGYWFKQFLSV